MEFDFISNYDFELDEENDGEEEMQRNLQEWLKSLGCSEFEQRSIEDIDKIAELKTILEKNERLSDLKMRAAESKI